jgi:ribosomal protein S18 acetylase RimI-like enzyme
MKVRTFAIRDYPEVRSLWIASGLEIRSGDELEGVRRKLARDRELFLVAEDEGEIVGTVMGAWDGRRGWMYHLGVRPDRHRTGVATRMVHELEARMRKIGVPKVNALIYPWNEASLEFFASAGYVVEDMKEAQKRLDGKPVHSNARAQAKSKSPRARKPG